MSINLYKEFLVEEEKFLKNLERNLKDQINRLSVEELSILKLISSKDPSQIDDVSNHELLPEDEPLFNLNGTELNSNIDAINGTINDPLNAHDNEINHTDNGTIKDKGDSPINNTMDETINNSTKDIKLNTNEKVDVNDKKSVDTPLKAKKIKIEPNVITNNVNTESETPSKISKAASENEKPQSSQDINEKTVPCDKDVNPTIKITNTDTKTNKSEPSTSTNKPKRRKMSRRKELSQKLKEMFDDKQNEPVTSLTPDKIKKETITVSPIKANESESNYLTSNENNKDIVMDDVVVNEIPLNLDLDFHSDGIKKDVTNDARKGINEIEKTDDVEEEEDEDDEGEGEDEWVVDIGET